jgi:hypothetical protein
MWQSRQSLRDTQTIESEDQTGATQAKSNKPSVLIRTSWQLSGADSSSGSDLH